MSYSYLTPSNIFQLYKDAKSYTDRLTVPFPEFSRIARNKPVDGLGNYPKVTDGTTASIIQKVPREAVQQLPTGVVEADQQDWLAIVAQFIYENRILPYANQDYGLFEKAHLLIEAGGTYGFGASYNRFAHHSQGFSPDVELIYWGDIAIQKGKKSGNACDYVFYRTWWQKSDIEALIDSETRLIESAKKRGETYESTWDIQNLKSIVDDESIKDQQATTDTEQDRGVDTNGIELVTGFQRGIKAKFYTFAPGSRKIVRTKVNRDPRGEMPINFFYFGIDGTNPLGRGVVEMVGSLQNLIDSRMQMAQYAAAYGLNPAVIEYGEADNSFEYAPNKVIHANDPNYKIVPIENNTAALNDFIQTQSYLQSQLYQLVASPHTSTPSNAGVVTDGKTPTALNMQRATLDIDINTISKHFEQWFEAWSEGAINIYFAERSGKEILQLDNKTADKLSQLPPSADFDPATAINANNQIIIDYDTATPALKFRVDATTSKKEDNLSQLKAFETLDGFINNSPAIAQMLPASKRLAIYNAVISLAGIEDPEKLRLTEEEQKQIEQAMQASSQPAQKSPSESITFKDAAAVAPRAAAMMLQQAGLPGNDLMQKANLQDQQVAQASQANAQQAMPDVTNQHIQELQQMGIPNDQIAQAIQMYNQKRQQLAQGAVNG